uniref:Uncharacterized protein n=1 Tax=Theropithecus gelada TaxID=9565 RepID=A0A8D2EI85_THEGE
KGIRSCPLQGHGWSLLIDVCGKVGLTKFLHRDQRVGFHSTPWNMKEMVPLPLSRPTLLPQGEEQRARHRVFSYVLRYIQSTSLTDGFILSYESHVTVMTDIHIHILDVV